MGSATDFEPFKLAVSNLDAVAETRRTKQPFVELVKLVRSYFPGRVRPYDSLAEQLAPLAPEGLTVSSNHRRSAEVGVWLTEVRRGNAPEACGTLLRWLWEYHPEEAKQFHEQWGVPAPQRGTSAYPSPPRAVTDTDPRALAQIEREEAEQTGRLSLIGLDVPYLPDQLARLPWLEALDLTSTPLRSLAGLERLPKLTTLNVTDTRLTSIAAPETVRSVEMLICQETHMSDLAGLERFTGLKVLNCERNQMLRSLRGIEACSRLESLSAARTPIRDLFPLRLLTQLTEINLEFTDIESLAGLEALQELRVLGLQWNRRLQSLAGIEGCRNLRIVHCRHNRIASLDPLAELPHLKILDLDLTTVQLASERFWQSERLKDVYWTAGSIAGVSVEGFQGEKGLDLSKLKSYLRRVELDR